MGRHLAQRVAHGDGTLRERVCVAVRREQRADRSLHQCESGRAVTERRLRAGLRDMGRYGEIWGDVAEGCLRAGLRDMGRYGETGLGPAVGVRQPPSRHLLHAVDGDARVPRHVRERALQKGERVPAALARARVVAQPL